jgi:hypothetical protein
VDTRFTAKDTYNQLEAVDKATNQGIFPGWERFIKVKEGHKKKPRPLVNENGDIIKTRRSQAGTALGRHIQLAFWEDLKGVDFHKRVS